jgi:feruloyl esterase
VNLPTTWNGKALQYGGGGFNGTLITGLAPLRDAAPGDALPLTRGYVTLGTDSGHQASAFAASELGTFALNDEMLTNFAYASYKKVKDVSVEVMRTFYTQAPRRMYYFGGSEGGREGLTMAQRFPADYDGIVSVVPVINWTGLFHAFVRNEVPQLTDWLQASKVPLISKGDLRCLRLPRWSGRRRDQQLPGLPESREPAGTALPGRRGHRHQLSFRRRARRHECDPHALHVLVPAGERPHLVSPWLYGHEDALDGPAAQSLVRWVTGTAAPAVPPNASTNATQWLYGSNWIRYAIARNANFDVSTYNPDNFVARVQATSALIDSTNPDLSAFFARGGKLIIRENGADRAQSPLMGINYYNAVVARFGQQLVDGSVRLYVSPASGHTGNTRSVTDQAPVPTMVDLLDPLDQWVTTGTAPPDALVQTVKAPVTPFTVQSSRPMCRYPNFPRYTAGDRLQASSYTCSVSQP